MKKIMIVLLAAFALSGCQQGKMSRWEASWNGYSEICVKGVTYLQFTSGASVEVDANGKPVPCH